MDASKTTCLLYDFLIESVCMGLLCVFGFCGNSLSMACLLKDKSKTATPFLLVSLEVADTLFLVTVLLLRVFTSLQVFTNWFSSMIWVMPYLGMYVYPCALMAATGTVYLTILVTVNRYISVCRPYEASDLCSVTHARKHVIIVTIVSILYNIPRFFEYEVEERIITNNHGTNKTVNALVASDLEKNKLYQIIYKNVMYCVVMFLVPLATLILLNCKLIKALSRTKTKRASLRGSSSRESPSRSEDDITLALIVVVVVFVLCQTPALVTQLLVSVLDAPQRICPNPFYYYERLSDLMVVLNSSVNFLIYCFCSRKFRQILSELVCSQLASGLEENTSSKLAKPSNSNAKRAWTQVVVPTNRSAAAPSAV